MHAAARAAVVVAALWRLARHGLWKRSAADAVATARTRLASEQASERASERERRHRAVYRGAGAEGRTRGARCCTCARRRGGRRRARGECGGGAVADGKSQLVDSLWKRGAPERVRRWRRRRACGGGGGGTRAAGQGEADLGCAGRSACDSRSGEFQWGEYRELDDVNDRGSLTMGCFTIRRCLKT